MRVASIFVGILVCLIGFQVSIAQEGPISPRIMALEKALKAGDASALANFWRELERKSTPLIEPMPGETARVMVTFIWRAEEKLENVVLVTGLEDFINIEKNQLQPLLDTNLWYKTYIARNNVRTVYRFSPNDNLVPLMEETDFAARIANWRRDPFNPKTFVFPQDSEGIVSREYTRSVLELPGAAPQPYVTPRSNVTAGKMETHPFTSKVLKNYRRIAVYTPPGYDGRKTYPLTVFIDRYAYQDLIPTPTILDNMIAAKVIPPMVAVFIGIPSETRTRELSCDPAFTDFAAHELIDWVQKKYKVTKKPAERIIAGSSQGAVAAAYIATRHPDVYGNVLSQSGLYWYTPQNDSEYEWFTRYIATLPRVKVRYYLEVGSLERGAIASDGPSIIVANRHLRSMLSAKGYKFDYSEFSGGHDYICWQGSLSDGLITLMREDKVEETEDQMPEGWNRNPIPE